MRDMFTTRFNIDIDKSARYITSDTAFVARAVADKFDDTDQVDCELHLINLVLEYGIGLRENTSTKQGLKTVVTPGGALPEGKQIIKTMRKNAWDIYHSFPSVTICGQPQHVIMPWEWRCDLSLMNSKSSIYLAR